jgi:predicted PurR-regulated permease PerM/methanogenic corrinoid protein MtbC1
MAQSEVAIKTSRFVLVASVCLVVAALYFSQEFLVPLALSVLVSFLLAPVVRRLERWRFPPTIAVLTTVVLAFALLGGIGLVVYNQLSDLSDQLPDFRDKIHQRLISLRHTDTGFVGEIKGVVEDVSAPTTNPSAALGDAHPSAATPVPVIVTNNTPSDSSTSPLQLLANVGARLLSPAGTAFIVIVITIFTLLQREELRDRLIRLVGRARLTVTTQALDDASERVSRYLLMQTIINGSVGLTVMITLWIIGKVNGHPFPSPALWGLLATMLRFIPYVGIWVSAVMPILLSWIFFSGTVAFETLAAYAGIEAIAANVFEPLLFGASTGITTIAVLVAAVFWTWLWGPVGLLLSTPMTVCMVVLGKYVPQLEFLSILLGDEPALDPPTRMYERLLSLEQEQAADLANEYAKKMTRDELYDDVMVRALAMAEVDHVHGKLEDDRYTTILRDLREIIEELGDTYRAEQRNAKPQPPAANEKDQSTTDRNTPALATPANVPDNGQLPSGCTMTVVLLPSHDEADEIAAIMFAQLLETRGYCATTISTEKLTSEMVSASIDAKADLVCVSALPPGAVTHSRYLCKRLHEKLPDIQMVVGLWTAGGDLKRAQERMACTGSVQMVGSFRQALEQVHQLIQHKLIKSESAVIPEILPAQV